MLTGPRTTAPEADSVEVAAMDEEASTSSRCHTVVECPPRATRFLLPTCMLPCNMVVATLLPSPVTERPLKVRA